MHVFQNLTRTFKHQNESAVVILYLAPAEEKANTGVPSHCCDLYSLHPKDWASAASLGLDL